MKNHNFKLLPTAITLIALTGCASVTPLNSENTTGGCNVKVFSSKDGALAQGEINELCVITGTSAFSFSHTVATAINKHKNKACDCGADNVYIQHQDAGTMGTASVTLVGFTFVNN